VESRGGDTSPTAPEVPRTYSGGIRGSFAGPNHINCFGVCLLKKTCRPGGPLSAEMGTGDGTTGVPGAGHHVRWWLLYAGWGGYDRKLTEAKIRAPKKSRIRLAGGMARLPRIYSRAPVFSPLLNR
jgi:hypothetical protein